MKISSLNNYQTQNQSFGKIKGTKDLASLGDNVTAAIRTAANEVNTLVGEDTVAFSVPVRWVETQTLRDYVPYDALRLTVMKTVSDAKGNKRTRGHVETLEKISKGPDLVERIKAAVSTGLEKVQEPILSSDGKKKKP